MHRIIDGMNVIGSRPDGWWRDRDGAARAFVARLQRLVRTSEEDVTVVFDGRPIDDLPEGRHEGVSVLYAAQRGRNAADDRIVELVRAAEDPAALQVVTSDRELRRRVEALGASVGRVGDLRTSLDAIED
jgi:predicted RNA-binding protein with PIN domain